MSMVVIPGTANEKSSDLGLTVINYREPDPVVQIDVIKSALEKHHPVISKMDIDPGVLEDVMLTARQTMGLLSEAPLCRRLR